MVVKILRKWTDRRKHYQYGLDDQGRLYCRDLFEDVDLVCVDNCFKVKGKYYYKFINPKTNKSHMVFRQ